MKMKLTLLSIFITLVGTQLYSQKIERFYDYRWKECKQDDARYYSIMQNTDSGWIRNDYYLREQKLQMKGRYIDESCKIPVGLFVYFYPNGNIESQGRFNDEGKKEGLWYSFYDDQSLKDSVVYINNNPVGTRLSWHKNGYLMDSAVYNVDGSGVHISWFDNGSPSSAGRYSSGYKLHGPWVFYHKNGNASSRETYDKGDLIDKKYYNEQRIEMDTTNNDRDAQFPGGIEAWKKYLSKKIYFPDQYKFINGDRAVVIIDFFINEEGKVENAYVSSPFHPAFDKIALNAIQKSPAWIPAKHHNREIKSYSRQPVTFEQIEY